MKEFFLTEDALSDLERIWRYTLDEWGADKADTYHDQLLERSAWLANNPSLGYHRKDIKNGYYSYPQGRHHIFYKLMEDQDILILRILHQEMDYESHFDRPL